MNEGLLSSAGEIICFVSADDVVTPGAVSSVVGFLEKHPHYDGVFGITARIDLQGRSIPYYIPFRTAPLYFYQYFAHISHCSLYVRKISLQRHNLAFDPSLKYNGDYDWIIRIHKEGLKIGLLRQELSRVRLHTDQTSQKHSDSSSAEAKRVIARHRINRPLYVVFNTLYRLLFKAWLLYRMVLRDGTGVLFKQWMNRYHSR
jgi:hypothetical protein